MSKKIRVAQIIGVAAAGGVESIIMNLYSNIDREKIEFHFFVENTCIIIDKEKIENFGGKVIFIPSYKKTRKYISELIRLFKEGNYDIVHSNMNSLSVFALYAAKKAGVKIRIAHSHSTANRKEWKKTIIKNILRPFSKIYATHFFACSEVAGKWLFGKKTFDNKKVVIINNGIDQNKFRYNEKIRNKIRKELNIENNKIIGHVGRFMTQKNHKFIIDVFNEIIKMDSTFKLLLIGDGPLEKEINKRINLLGLGENVIFLGTKNNVNDYYNAMDYFVFPSLYEGLGIVLIEAQFNGIPCFCSDIIPNEAIISDNITAISLKNSPKYWANKILENNINTDRNNINLNTTSKKYVIKNEANKLLNIYQSILEE